MKYGCLNQEDSDEARAAQGAFLAAVGLKPDVVQWAVG